MATDNLLRVHGNKMAKSVPFYGVGECLREDISGLVKGTYVSYVDRLVGDHFGHPMEIHPVGPGEMPKFLAGPGLDDFYRGLVVFEEMQPNKGLS